nr:hypothetical protein [Tanacetum cinerariifolium]
YKEYRHPAACGRSSAESRKLPEEAQPYQARYGIRIQYLPQTIWRKEDDCMRETSGCGKGSYDSSYAAPIFTEGGVWLSCWDKQQLIGGVWLSCWDKQQLKGGVWLSSRQLVGVFDGAAKAAAIRKCLVGAAEGGSNPEVTLPPRKRLNIVHCPGYKAGESSVVASARPIEGRRADYGFVDSVEAEIRRRRAEDIGYGIRETWIDPRDVAEEEALTTLEGVNTRVTKLAAMQEQDPQDIYEVMEDTQENGTKESGLKANYKDFMKCQPLYFKGTEEVVELTQWFERMETVFRISNCLPENQVKFATCTLLASALTWWNSYLRIVGNDVTYMMAWIELKKKMADKYCPRNEMTKIETEF